MSDPLPIWQSVYDEHHKRLLEFLFRHFKHADIGGVAQETWCKLFELIRDGKWDDEKGSAWSWLCTVARNRAFNVMEKQRNTGRREQAFVEDPAVGVLPAESGASVATLASEEGRVHTISSPDAAGQIDWQMTLEKLLNNCPSTVLNPTQRRILDAFVTVAAQLQTDGVPLKEVSTERILMIIAERQKAGPQHIRQQFYLAKRKLLKWFEEQGKTTISDLN